MKINYTLYALLILVFFSCKKKESKSTKYTPEITVLNKEKADDSPILAPGIVKDEMVVIKEGSYISLYGKKNKQVTVKPFLIDVYPVTNQQYLDFVKQYPAWRKSLVKRIFAEENYLNNWQGDTVIGGNINPNSPVTYVSWFAAKAYCESYDKRLPTVDEWEYIAMADENEKDARSKKTFNQYILNWYEKPYTFRNEIGKTYKNYWGVYDIHGLVWEWTEDFNSILMSGENRTGSTEDKSLFCGSGSLTANDLMNYAAFMRYAFRGSIKANYAIQNLGFRCAKDIK